MKAEAALLSDEDLKTAVEEIQHWHKTGILPEPSSLRKFVDDWQTKKGFDKSILDMHGGENAILFEAAQRWIASLDKWQPIEEAPPGIDVLTLREYGYMQVAMKSEDQMLCIHGYPVRKPTHFQPLPEPPKQKPS